jgi:plasmid stabilization system protein ParE
MKLTWTERAVSDLERLHEFLASVNPKAAARAIQAIVRRAGTLPHRPRIGERIERYDPREIRRILAGRYEVPYELSGAGIHILRIWHTRENR